MSDNTLYCRACRIVVSASQRFCAACGEIYPSDPPDTALHRAGPLQDIAGEVRPLLREKATLAGELEDLVEMSAARPLTDDERRQWERTYQRWRDVSFEITLAVDRVLPRAEVDRRSTPPPSPPPTPERSHDDRRDPFWNRAP